MGDLPPCNRFRADASAAVGKHPLELAGCETCGLVQLVDPMPVEMIVPRVSWIRYNEPEGHLDALAQAVVSVNRRPIRSAVGIGPFEAPFLSRLAAIGIETAQPVLAATVPAGHHPYLETWQGAVAARSFTDAAQPADLVSCRYLLEHAREPKRFLNELSQLASEDGLVLVEVPDSQKFLTAGDYGFPWEEHVSYFVEETLLTLCGEAGFEVAAFLRYPGQLEDALVAILKKGGTAAPGRHPDEVFGRYRDGFEAVRRRVGARVLSLSGGRRERLALFGVGHQAIMFANALEIAPLIGRVTDDDVNKRGAVPPGFSVAITSSADLLADMTITACLLAVSPRAEPKVRDLLQPLASRGVALHSIFAGVPGSIMAE